MRVVRLEETVPHNGVIRLHHLSDIHCGAPDLAEDELRERIELIRQDPSARWTMGGDGGDLIRHNDPRYEISSLHPRYRQATDIRYATLEHLHDLFEPIKDKCWGWADGNHENKLNKFYGSNFGVEVCCNLGLESRYVGYRGFVDVGVTIGGRKAKSHVLIDIQHGWQIGRLKGAFLVQAERELGMTEASIVLRGHNHQPNGHVFVTIGVSARGNGAQGQVVQKMRTVLNGGAWVRGYTERRPINRNRLSEVEGDIWTETKGFRAEPIGGPVLLLRFDQGYGRSSTSTFSSARVEHTLIKGHITAETLGL